MMAWLLRPGLKLSIWGRTGKAPVSLMQSPDVAPPRSIASGTAVAASSRRCVRIENVQGAAMSETVRVGLIQQPHLVLEPARNAAGLDVLRRRTQERHTRERRPVPRHAARAVIAQRQRQGGLRRGLFLLRRPRRLGIDLRDRAEPRRSAHSPAARIATASTARLNLRMTRPPLVWGGWFEVVAPLGAEAAARRHCGTN